MVKRRKVMPKINKLLQQTFIELYRTQGWTPKQIADQFNVKERTVISVVEKREPTGFCLCCGKEFTSFKYLKRRFGSRKCANKSHGSHEIQSESI